MSASLGRGTIREGQVTSMVYSKQRETRRADSPSRNVARIRAIYAYERVL